jgi:hypothetical protein
MSEITVFTARKVITMNPGSAGATAVAVRDGRIAGAMARGIGPINVLQMRKFFAASPIFRAGRVNALELSTPVRDLLKERTDAI